MNDYRRTARFLCGEDTTWPDPEAVGDLEHRLRYADTLYDGQALTVEDRLVLASVCAAYREFAIGMGAPAKLARLRRIVRELANTQALEMERGA